MNDLRTAAVLVPVYRDSDGELRIVLVVRADDGGLHGGQLGLPGGLDQSSYPQLATTALGAVPMILTLWPPILMGLHAITKRRAEGGSHE